MKRYAEFAAIAQEQIEEAMKQEEVLDACAQVMTDTVMHDGVIHVFGCGHSQMFAEELCFRTGGLVPVNAIIIPLLIPLALRGVKYKPIGASALLRRNLFIYGLGGIIVPFIGIKLIDMLVSVFF